MYSVHVPILQQEFFVQNPREKLIGVLLLALFSFAVTIGPANASSFVSGFEGSTSLSSPGNGTLSVSYAVVDTGSAGAASFLATLGVTSTDTSRYVYLYEISNTSLDKVGFFSLASNPALYNSQGAIAGYAFTNAANGGRAVAPNGDKTFNYNASTNNPNNSFTTASGLIASSGADNDSPNYTGFDYRNSSGHDNLASGQYGELVYLTSNYAPMAGTGQVQDGAVFGPGFMPVATPEPQSYALMVSGLLGLGALARWRRRAPKLA